MEENKKIKSKKVNDKKYNETKIDTNQDVVYNDDVVYDSNDQVTDKIKQLQEKLKICKKEKQDYLDGWQRVKADYVNLQKKFDEERKQYITFAEENIIEELLPVVDSFDMAISNKEAWEAIDENWRIGVEYIYSQLLSILEAHGIKQVNPVGEAFDPNYHTSVEQIAAKDSTQDHIIQKVMQKGYSLKEKTLRSAKVVVAVWDNN